MGPDAQPRTAGGPVRSLALSIAVLLVAGIAQLPGADPGGKAVVAGSPRSAGAAVAPPVAPPGPAVVPAVPDAAAPAGGPVGPADGSVDRPEEPLVIPYRVEVRSPDPSLADAPAFVDAVLADPRGWSRAAIRFVPDPAAPFAILLVEGEEAQALCEPYDVGGRFSCQNGPLVVLNAIRWREGVAHWPADDLVGYRTMLVNHEVGHLIGMHHLRCGEPGRPAPVMEQQSGTLRGCLPNPWPTPIEIRLAATHQFQIAPPPLDVLFPP